MNPLPLAWNADRAFDARVIEILAAVAILVVLMALALRDYSSYLEKAHVAEGYVLARPFQIDAVLFHAHHGSWSVDAPVSTGGQSVQDLQLQEGVVTLRYSQTRRRPATHALSLRPTVKTAAEWPATVFWSCGYAVPKAGFTAHGENRTTLSPADLSALCR